MLHMECLIYLRQLMLYTLSSAVSARDCYPSAKTENNGAIFRPPG